MLIPFDFNHTGCSAPIFSHPTVWRQDGSGGAASELFGIGGWGRNTLCDLCLVGWVEFEGVLYERGWGLFRAGAVC